MNKIKNSDQLQKHVSEILYYKWDPIGVKDFGPAARDEYDLYVAVIIKAIKSNADVEALAKILYKIETIEIGLKGDIHACRVVARLILDWADSQWLGVSQNKLAKGNFYQEFKEEATGTKEQFKWYEGIRNNRSKLEE